MPTRAHLIRSSGQAGHPGRKPGPGSSVATSAALGYYGRPVLKPPPWTWEVPVYFFAGGLAGASAVVALAARVAGTPGSAVRTALAISVIGVLISAALLVSDLGRPARFLNMLRVFKWRSPMSVGVWLLTAFGAAASGALLLEGGWVVDPAGTAVLGWGLLVVAALLGAVVATYTGVLLAASVVPAWNSHALLLPLHFGAAALGSAAALLELLGYPLDGLHVIGFITAAVETAIWAWTELRTHGARDRALRSGSAGGLVRASATLMGPVALLLRALGLRPLAAASFLVGAFLSRFGWMEAGRRSTTEVEAAL